MKTEFLQFKELLISKCTPTDESVIRVTPGTIVVSFKTQSHLKYDTTTIGSLWLSKDNSNVLTVICEIFGNPLYMTMVNYSESEDKLLATCNMISNSVSGVIPYKNLEINEIKIKLYNRPDEYIFSI